MSPLLSALGMLFAVLVVLVGAYVFTRWAGKNLGGFGSILGGNGRIEVLDRASIGKDQYLLVVRAGQRYLLLGSGSSGLTLLMELTLEEGESWKVSGPQSGPEEKQRPNFRALMGWLKEKNDN